MDADRRNDTGIFRYTDVEYTPQDCFGFSDPFGGRIEYSEKKPEIAVAVKPDPVELGHRASVAASSTAGGRARGAGIRQ